MNLLAWALGLGLLSLVLATAVNFHRATVCRQEAWAKSFEMSSRHLFDRPKAMETAFLSRCRIFLMRRAENTHWNGHLFVLQVKGKL